MNAALHKRHLTLEDLYARYGPRELVGLAFYAEHRHENPLEVVGADSTANAVSYTLPQPADLVRKSSTSQPAVFVPAS